LRATLPFSAVRHSIRIPTLAVPLAHNLIGCLPFMKPVVNRISFGFLGTSLRNTTNKSGTKTEPAKGPSSSWGRKSFVHSSFGNSHTVRTKAEDERPLAQHNEDDLEQGVNLQPVELRELPLAAAARDMRPRGITVTTEVFVERREVDGDIV
jgi:hypothetical protein